MTKDQEANPIKTLNEIEMLLDPAPSPGGDVVWLVKHRIESHAEDRALYTKIADGCRSDASRMGDRALRAEAALKQVRDTLQTVLVTAPGYDWNADPASLTLKTGEAFAVIDKTFAEAK